MSLLKQLFLAICLFLVVAFSGSFVSSVENSREQLRGQLRSMPRTPPPPSACP